MFKRILATLIFFVVAVSPAFAGKTSFSDGNPATGVKGTKVTAAFLNAVNKHFCTGLDVDGDCALAYGTVTGTNDLVTTITPTTAFPASYVNGMPIYLKSAATNTGAMTLNINSIGQAAIKKNGSSALAAGDVQAGQMVALAFDGTNFQLLNGPPGGSGALNGYATLDSNGRIVQTANTLWDGTAGRSVSPSLGANVIPVADGMGSLRSFFHADLEIFTSTTLPSSKSWIAPAYGNGWFVAVSKIMSTTAAYSINGGQTWTASTLPASLNWSATAYGNNSFVTVATGTTGAAYSTDGGQTWTASTMPSSQNWEGSAYGNGRFVAVARSGFAAAYSTNGGQTWTASTLPASMYAVAYGNGRFVVSGNGTSAAYSTNGGQTWTASTMPSTQTWAAICYGNGRFVAISQSSSAAYSTDGGQTWTESTLPSSQTWQGCAYGNGMFVATGCGTNCTAGASSIDGGATWSAITMPSSQTWGKIAYGAGRFVVVSDTSNASTAGAYATSVLSLP